MADLKISALTSATTPLAGTELVPLVQSGVTKNATVEQIANGTRPNGTANSVVFLNGSKVPTYSANLQFTAAGGLGVLEAPVAGYKLSVDGDWWLGNGAGTVIGTVLNDGGWFGFAGSANVSGTKIKDTNEVKVTIGSTDVVRVQSSEFFPATDNSKTLGLASFRWSTVYAANGLINTSDARTKTEIANLDEVERRVAVKIKGLIKKFKFIDAVQARGDSARIHVGVVAQEVADAFASENLDPSRYGLFCFDKWDAQYEDEFAEKTILKKIINESGDEVEVPTQVQVKTGKQILIREAGELFGIRYDQLLALVIASL